MSSVRRLLLIIGLLVAGLGGAPVQAAAPPGGAPALTTADLERLIATLEDDGKRGEFLATLKAALAAQGAASEEPETLGARALGGLSATLGRAGEEIGRLVMLAGGLPGAVGDGLKALDSAEERAAALTAVLTIALVLTAGLLAHGLARVSLRRPLAAVEQRIPGASLAIWGVLVVTRLVLVLVPPALIAGAAWGMLALVHPAPPVRTGATVVVGAFACYQVVMALTRALLAPRQAGLRVLPLSDGAALDLTVWVRRLTLYLVSGYFALEAAVLLGLSPASHQVLLRVLALGLALLVITFILRHRAAVAAWMRHGTVSPSAAETAVSLKRRSAGQMLRDRLAHVWHILAAAWVAVAFVVWAADLPGGFGFLVRASVVSVLALGAAFALGVVVERLIERLGEAAAAHDTAFPGLERRVRRYAQPLAAGVRGVLWFAAAVVVIEAWGGPALAWIGAGLGKRLVGAALVVGSVVVVALLVWEAVNIAIERALAPPQAGGDGPVVVLSARARTLIPLARNALLITLVAMVTLVMLSEIGVNIVPLLAGAGVIGLAIGFGAQKLVQDVITGAFMLFENTMAIGDVVRVGTYTGTVEGLTIRSLRLRDVQGNVHTLPFSSVDSVTNMSKDFAYCLTEVGVAYREDTDHVTEVLQAIGAELRADPAVGPDILEPLEVQGLDRFADSAVILRVRFKTRPLRQWAVSRAFNRLIKKRFDEQGIEIPFPHTTVYFGEDRQGKAPPARLRLEEGANMDGLPSPQGGMIKKSQ